MMRLGLTIDIVNRQNSSGGGAGGYSPIALSTLKYWYDGNDATLNEATAGGGGGNPDVGAAVGRMKGYTFGGSVVDGFDAIGAGNRPLRASGGGVTLDGTNDRMTGFSSLDMTVPWYVAAVILSTDQRGNRGLLGRWNMAGTSLQWFLIPTSFGTASKAIGGLRNAGNSANYTSGDQIGVSDGTKRYISLFWDGTTNGILNLDGTEYTFSAPDIRAVTGAIHFGSYSDDETNNSVAATVRDVLIATGAAVTTQFDTAARAAHLTWAKARY